jgi:hypothetical protein
MEEHHTALLDTEDDAGNPPARQIASDLPQVSAQGPNEWHSDGPGKLDIFNVLAQDFAFVRLKAFQPFPHRLAAAV